MYYLLISAFFWNFGLGIVYVTVPLYAYSLGMSGLAIGSLVALPALVQIPGRLVSGMVAHRWGERRLLVITFATLVAAGPVYALAHGYVALLAAQFIANIARGLFWAGAQGMTSRLPGPRSVRLGWLQSAINLGLILGTATGGFLVAAAGFPVSFLTVCAIAALAALACLGLPEAVPTASPAGILQHYRAYFHSRPIYFAMLCSFWAAMSFSLGQTFFPVLLVKVGYSTGVVGALLALRPIGAIVCGMVVAKYLTPARRQSWIAWSLAATGLAVGLTPLLTEFIWVGLFLGGLGMTSAAMDLYHQLTAARVGDASGGGAAAGLAVGGLGWGLSHVVISTVFGALVDLVGLFNAFHLLGTAVVVMAAFVTPLHRWAFATPARSDLTSAAPPGGGAAAAP